MTTHVHIVDAHPLVDDVFAAFAPALGADAAAYRGHVYRVLNLTRALQAEVRTSDELALAAAFHDLGIWSARTFDYLAPSVHAAAHWLDSQKLELDGREVARMITLHHKLTRCAAADGAQVECFRRADFVDVSFGLVRHGVPRAFVRELGAAFPRAGFHRCLARAGLRWFVRHPARPLPMLRW